MGNKRTIGNPLELRGSNIDQQIFDYYLDGGRLRVIVNKEKTRMKVWLPNGDFANISIKDFYYGNPLEDLGLDQDQINFLMDVLDVVKQQDEFIVITEPEVKYSYFGLSGRYIITENEVEDSITLSLPQLNLTVPSHEVKILSQFARLLESGQVRNFIEMVVESSQDKKDELRDAEDGVNESDVTDVKKNTRDRESDVTGPDKNIGFMPVTRDQTVFQYYASNGRHYTANVKKKEQLVELKEFPGSRYSLSFKELFEDNEVMEKLGNEVATWLQKAVILADRGADLFVSDDEPHVDYSYSGLMGDYNLRIMEKSEQIAVTLPSIRVIVEKEDLPELKNFLSWVEQGQLNQFITRKLADDAL